MVAHQSFFPMCDKRWNGCACSVHEVRSLCVVRSRRYLFSHITNNDNGRIIPFPSCMQSADVNDYASQNDIRTWQRNFIHLQYLSQMRRLTDGRDEWEIEIEMKGNEYDYRNEGRTHFPSNKAKQFNATRVANQEQSKEEKQKHLWSTISKKMVFASFRWTHGVWCVHCAIRNCCRFSFLVIFYICICSDGVRHTRKWW